MPHAQVGISRQNTLGSYITCLLCGEQYTENNYFNHKRRSAEHKAQVAMCEQAIAGGAAAAKTNAAKKRTKRRVVSDGDFEE